MENIVHEYQKEAVNKKQAEYTKPVLDFDDIVSIQVPTKTRGACDHPWLPAMFTKTIIKSNQETQYEVCSRHGVIAGVFPRNQLYHNKYLTAELLCININESQAMKQTQLSVAKASSLYNKLSGKNFCKCKSDCSKNSRCSCVMLGKLCVKKCHMKRSDGAKVACRNCATTKHNYKFFLPFEFLSCLLSRFLLLSHKKITGNLTCLITNNPSP
jgi:hypothetical protein